MTISITASYCTYTGDGTTQVFDVKSGSDGIYFETASELTVTLRNGDTIYPQTISTHYTVSGAGSAAGSITFLTAPPSGYEVRIERNTPRTQGLNLTQAGAFSPPAIMGAFDKLTRITQDLARGSGGGSGSGTYDNVPLTLDASGDAWDASSKPLGNLDDATEDDQAVTLGQITTVLDAATDAATTAAATSATQAASSATAAATSATNAATSATNAAASASDASDSADAAATSETNAGSSASAASTSAGNASTSETNAATSAVAAASAVGWSFTYSTTTAMADPGAGTVRFNNATIASATAIAFDITTADSGNPDIRAWMLTWDDSTNTALTGTLTFRKRGAGQQYAIFSVTAVTDNTGWVQVTATLVAGSPTWSDGDVLIVSFARTGNKGTDGAGSGDFSTNTSTSVDGELVLFSGTGGKMGKRATTTGVLKAASGVVSAAASGTDYAPATSGTAILKGNGSGGFSSAASGTDYAPATSGSAILKGNGSGGFSSTTAGSDYMHPGTTSTITKGFIVTPNNIGTVSSGTTTPDPANSNYQYMTNNGAHTIAAPGSDCAIDILVTNGASAGAITMSGFTAPSGGGGDTYNTTNANKFILMIRRINSVSTYAWKALQ